MFQEFLPELLQRIIKVIYPVKACAFIYLNKKKIFKLSKYLVNVDNCNSKCAELSKIH